MGIYAITGASKGIGAEALKYLRGLGHDVINIDIDGGDISADLGIPEGRQKVIKSLHENCPNGLDGLILNAGIALAAKPSKVLSVNFFGPVTLAEGLYSLLKKKKGNCVVTVSGSIAYITRNKYYVDALLTNCGDEARIGRLVDSFEPQHAGNVIYGSTKIALVRWIRRMAPSWAAAGVTLNALAPGAVATTIMPDTEEYRNGFDTFIMGMAMPIVYKEHRMMEASEVGPPLAMLALPEMKGVSGAVLYCDGGTSAFLHPEKFY